MSLLVSLTWFLVSLTMTRLLVAPMWLLVSPKRLTALLPHYLLSSLMAPPALRPSLFFTRRCTRLPSYLASMVEKWI
jgi:hypothetical protein